MNVNLFSTAYFPPVQFFRFRGTEPICLEQFENFSKQSYRNRCNILSGNGVLPLIVPVCKGNHPKIPIRDTRPDYSIPWQKLHWISIRSAYGKAPFFLDYEHELKVIFEKKIPFLFDLNFEIIQLVCSMLGLKNEWVFTNEFKGETEADPLDFRFLIHPKRNWKELDRNFRPLPYYQVFADRFGFIPNLSVLDLIFNEGPNALSILKESFVHS